MKLTIGGKEYTFKFSVDASLNDECVERTTSLIMSIGEAQSEESVNAMIHSIANVPIVALSVFYAGLLEHHGMGRDADHSIRSKEDAKELIKTYFAENPDNEDANFYGVLNMMVEQMGEDGFFDLIGLKQAFGMDHKKKSQSRKKKTIEATEN